MKTVTTDDTRDVPQAMQVFVYRGSRRAETYLYLAAPDALERVPPALLEAMGELDLVMTLELYPGRPMARENPATVIRNVRERGYHLQLPPVDTPGSTRLQ